jgi:hypothetical protein
VFTRIFSALGRVAEGASAFAESLQALAATLREASAHVRRHLGLDGTPAAEQPMLEQQLPQAVKNGRRVKPAS